MAWNVPEKKKKKSVSSRSSVQFIKSQKDQKRTKTILDAEKRERNDFLLEKCRRNFEK